MMTLPLDQRLQTLLESSAVSKASYKLILVDDQWIAVPRERFLKKQLAGFWQHFCQEYGVCIKPMSCDDPFEEDYFDFNDDSLEEEAFVRNCQENPYETTYGYVNKLPIFDDLNFYFVKHGHLTSGASPYNVRSWVLHQASSVAGWDRRADHIKGAIEIEINSKNKKCEINLLGVDEKCQKRGYGAMLFHTALYMGMLHGCHKFSLTSTSEGIPFYVKQGFYLRLKSPELLQNEQACHHLKRNPSFIKLAVDCDLENDLSKPHIGIEMLKEQMQRYVPGFDPVVSYKHYANKRDQLTNRFNKILQALKEAPKNPLFHRKMVQSLESLSSELFMPVKAIEEIKSHIQVGPRSRITPFEPMDLKYKPRARSLKP